MDSPNPFSRPHGVRNPAVYAARTGIDERLTTTLADLSNLQYAQGISLLGVRGSGKTTELLRLDHQLRARGWLSLHISVDTQQSFTSQLATALSKEIRERGGRDPFATKGQGRTTVTAKAKVPFTPVELGIERAPKGNSTAQSDLIRNTILLYIAMDTPVALIVDEGDFLTVDDMEGVIAPIAHDAAVMNLPFLFVSCGTTYDYLRSLRGYRTFVETLTFTVELARLTDSEARNLIVNTARIGGQDWSQSRALSDAIAECKGVPRFLHSVGYSAFAHAQDLGTDHALRNAVRECIGSRAQAKAVMVSEVPNLDLYAAVERRLRAHRVDLLDLVTALNTELGQDRGADFAGMRTCLDTMARAGLIECHIDGTYEWI